MDIKIHISVMYRRLPNIGPSVSTGLFPDANERTLNAMLRTHYACRDISTLFETLSASLLTIAAHCGSQIRKRPPLLHTQFLLFRQRGGRLLEQPDVCKQRPNRDEEQDPHLPAHARLLRHPEHPPHRALEPDTAVPELVVDRGCQLARVADLVADGHGEGF